MFPLFCCCFSFSIGLLLTHSLLLTFYTFALRFLGGWGLCCSHFSLRPHWYDEYLLVQGQPRDSYTYMSPDLNVYKGE